MPLRQAPSFKAVQEKEYNIPNPGIGGLNLKDLEYKQDVNQSPYMKNMMYRNGSFSKRYGQIKDREFDGTIYNVSTFNDELVIHEGTNLRIGDKLITSSLPEKKGLFAKFAQSLYYICDKYYSYAKDDNKSSSNYGKYVWGEAEPYVPELFINCKPDGSYADKSDDLNLIGNKFTVVYHGDGTSKDYYFYKSSELKDKVNWSITPKVSVDLKETTAFTVDATNKKITFNTAPSEGNLNVEVTYTLKDDALKEDRDRIFASKYCVTFGGNNNSRLFLAGGGDSKYFFSESYDAKYWPENNWAILGNSEEDITGFGLQYNVLIVFKPNELYSLTSYTQTSSTTVIESQYGLEAFKAQMVNAVMGCDAPNTIQLIDNKLTWFNSKLGICTLVSTNIVDERNVRQISRNVDRTNSFGIKGILDYTEDLNSIQSVDFDNKYFLVFPQSGNCYVWDYELSPYYYTSSKETDAKILDFFLFDNFFVKQFIKIGIDLYYVSSHANFSKSLIKLNSSFADLDFNQDGEPDPIKSFYMTPFLQFNAFNYLKNVKNIYIQCRGDTASVINLYYYTDESLLREQDPESIRIGGRLWQKFEWDIFQWISVNWAYTFRRKCSLKKIQMCAFYFDNDELNRDMSISNIGLQYQIVKNVK